MFSLFDSPLFMKNSPPDSNYLYSPISTNSNDSLTNNEKKNLSINLNFSFSSNPLTPLSPNDLNTSSDSSKINKIKDYLVYSPLNSYYTNYFANNFIENNNEEINEENIFDFILEKEENNDNFSTNEYINLNQSISQLNPSIDYVNDYISQNVTTQKINNQSYDGSIYSGQNQNYQPLNYPNCQSSTCQVSNCNTLNCNNYYWEPSSPTYDSNLFLRDYIKETILMKRYIMNSSRYNDELKKDKKINNSSNHGQTKNQSLDNYNYKKFLRANGPKKSVSHVSLFKQDFDLVKNFAHQLIFGETSNRFTTSILQSQVKKWFFQNVYTYNFTMNTNELCIFHLNENINDSVRFGIIKIGPKSRFFQAPKNCFHLYLLLSGDVMLKNGSDYIKYKSKDYYFFQINPLCQHSILNLCPADAFLFFAISR